VSLESSVALVTGGGRGLGAILARRLAEEGLAVAITGRDEGSLDANARELRALGASVLAVPGDVADPASVVGVVARTAAALGPVDLLVNNAGITEHGPVWETDPGAWWRVVEVNLRGPFLYARAVLGAMIERGRGRIVNVSSGVGNAPSADQSAYAVSKAALTRLTDSLAAQVEPRGVKVFAISPGLLRTDMGIALAERRGDVAAGDWASPAAAAELVARIGRGDLDALSGRFIRAFDDVDALLARQREIVQQDLLALRLREG
jgi:3-oxoacyl-[acyl-carrier protein] reductase